jgi:hypothetical protein
MFDTAGQPRPTSHRRVYAALPEARRGIGTADQAEHGSFGGLTSLRLDTALYWTEEEMTCRENEIRGSIARLPSGLWADRRSSANHRIMASVNSSQSGKPVGDHGRDGSRLAGQALELCFRLSNSKLVCGNTYQFWRD